jgi:hypothetical protein
MGTALRQSLEILHDTLVELAFVNNARLVTLGKHLSNLGRKARKRQRRGRFLGLVLFLGASGLPAFILFLALLCLLLL